jgi:hypothetical protein
VAIGSKLLTGMAKVAYERFRVTLWGIKTMPGMRMAYRDPASGQYAVAPGKQPAPPRVVDRILIHDQRTVLARRVKAHANTLRAELRRRGIDITAPVDLRVMSCARVQTRLEVVQSEMARGTPVNDDDLVRLTNTLTRGLAALGLAKSTLAPPAAPKQKPLIDLLRQHGKAAPAP